MLKLTEDLLQQVRRIAVAAGDAILPVYQHDSLLEQKDGG